MAVSAFGRLVTVSAWPKRFHVFRCSRASWQCSPIISLLSSGAAPRVSHSANLTTARVGGMKQVLFIECGFGNDQHGQNATKAAVRACRNAIEFNSIPSIPQLVPGGYQNMKLHVQLGVPEEYHNNIDLAEVAKVFSYGNLAPIDVKAGGMIASSGIALAEMGDTSQDMVIVVACVTVGH